MKCECSSEMIFVLKDKFSDLYTCGKCCLAATLNRENKEVNFFDSTIRINTADL